MPAFLNVLDSAINYSVPDSEVFVCGRVQGAFVAVRIRDRGAGISEADFPHIFEAWGMGHWALLIPIAQLA